MSRSRFWGTPLPIWASEDGSELRVVGSVEELQRLSGRQVLLKLCSSWASLHTIMHARSAANLVHGVIHGSKLRVVGCVEELQRLSGRQVLLSMLICSSRQTHALASTLHARYASELVVLVRTSSCM